MQEDFSRALRRSVSNERLDGYVRRGANGGEDNLFSHYAWNIALSESLYPSLQCLEVCLRNSLHNALAGRYNRLDWYDHHLVGEGEKSKLAKVKRDLTDRGTVLSPANIVAELTFGFWTCLLDRRYEGSFWPHSLATVVPKMPRTMRTRQNLSRQVETIRKLRNRAFHHEPIWHWNNLVAQQQSVLSVIGWISPAMQTFVQSLDRFPQVQAEGITKYQSLVSTMGDPPGK